MKIPNPASTEKIAHAIRSSPLSQADIARSLGISDKSVSCYVSGMRKPGPSRLVTLAQVLHVSVLDLIQSDPRDL